jgi:hypothetical protein
VGGFYKFLILFFDLGSTIKMPHSFIAYIDESGDDGLHNARQPGVRGGQSSWLVISACIFRFTRDKESVAWRNSILSKIPEKKASDLHFTKLNHAQKVVTSQTISELPMRAINILSNKLTIPAGIYDDKNQLYFYLTRYLIERISWFCRDYRRSVQDGDGRVQIIFSRRGGMSYLDFRAYLLRLQADNSGTVQIHWPVIDIDGIAALDHKRRAGLQLADAIASAFAAGVEANPHGNCESRYAEILKPITYCRNKNYFSYGVKLVPKLEDMEPSNEQMRFINLFR